MHLFKSRDSGRLGRLLCKVIDWLPVGRALKPPHIPSYVCPKIVSDSDHPSREFNMFLKKNHGQKRLDALAPTSEDLKVKVIITPSPKPSLAKN